MTIDWTQIIVPIASAFAGAASGWVFGRRQAKANAESVEINNMIQVMEQWRRLYEEVRVRAEELKCRVEKLEQMLEDKLIDK